jgi:hypothetical protein
MEMQIPCRNPLRKTKRRGRGVRRVGSNLVPLFLMEGHGSAIEENRFWTKEACKIKLHRFVIITKFPASGAIV